MPGHLAQRSRRRGSGSTSLSRIAADRRRAAARAAAAGCGRCRGSGRSASRAAAGRRRPWRPGRATARLRRTTRQRLGDRGLGAEDDRLGRHQAAGGVLVVGEQAPQRRRPRRAPSAGAAPPGAPRAARRAGRRRRRAPSPRARRRRGSSARPAEDLDLVVLGQLLEHVGEPLVVQRRGDLGATRRAEVVDDLGEVGGLEVLVRLEQADRALAVGGLAQADDVLDRRRAGSRRGGARAGPARRGSRRCARRPAPRPSRGCRLLDARRPRRSRRRPRPRRVRTWTGRSKQLGDDQGLVGALLEAAHVDQAGGDDLTGVDRGDPGHRHEDPAPPGHLDDQADDARPRVRPRLKVTTTSRTRPTWSPSGSKTLSSVRRPTKTRVGVLTRTGYRGRGARSGHLAGAVTPGCCGGRRPGRASARAASRWSPWRPGAPAPSPSRRRRTPGPPRAGRAG